MKIRLVFIDEEHVFSSSDFETVFIEVGCISVKCKYHVASVVSYGSVRTGSYVIK